MTWKEYLISKKIDPNQFKSGNNRLFRELDLLFSQLHPDSFTAQKLYLINRIRRMYTLERVPKETNADAAKKVKPKIAPRVKR